MYDDCKYFFIIYKEEGLGLDKTLRNGIWYWNRIISGLVINFGKIKKYVKDKYNTDNHQVVELSSLEEEVTNNQKELNIRNEEELNRYYFAFKAEKFDFKTRKFLNIYKYLRHCCDSFSHGANDVANAIGPFVLYHISRVDI